MILIPKPSSCEQDQSGGQVTPDTMDQFWQRRLLVDQLTTAPHVDRMMKLLGDMKQVEGQALPSSLLGQGPNSSDYFRLQGQLKNIPTDQGIRRRHRRRRCCRRPETARLTARHRQVV